MLIYNLEQLYLISLITSLTRSYLFYYQGRYKVYIEITLNINVLGKIFPNSIGGGGQDRPCFDLLIGPKYFLNLEFVMTEAVMD